MLMGSVTVNRKSFLPLLKNCLCSVCLSIGSGERESLLLLYLRTQLSLSRIYFFQMKIVFFSFSRGLPFPIEPDWDNMRWQDWSNWVKMKLQNFYHNVVRCTKVHFICSSNILCRTGFKEENIATLPAHSESHYVTPPHIYCDITHRINPSGGFEWAYLHIKWPNTSAEAWPEQILDPARIIHRCSMRWGA